MQASIQHFVGATDTLVVLTGGATGASTYLIQIVSALIIGILSFGGVWYANKSKLKEISVKVKELDLRAKQLELEYKQRQKEQDVSVAKCILPQCLDALQGTYVKAMGMSSILSGLNAMGNLASMPGEDRETHRLRLHDELKQIRDWYDSHCVYIPKEIRDLVLQITGEGHWHIDGLFGDGDSSSRLEVWSKYAALVKKLCCAMEAFMSKYNLVDVVLNEPTNSAK